MKKLEKGEMVMNIDHVLGTVPPYKGYVLTSIQNQFTMLYRKLCQAENPLYLSCVTVHNVLWLVGQLIRLVRLRGSMVLVLVN